MNNNIELENNKVVYINEDEEDNNTATTEMLVAPTTIKPEYTEENTRIETDFIANDDNEVDNEVNNNDDDEFEEFTNKEDLLLNLKQSGYESDGGDISDSDSVVPPIFSKSIPYIYDLQNSYKLMMAKASPTP